MNIWLIVILMLISTLVAASGSLFLKKGANVNVGGFKGAFKNGWLWMGVVFYVASASIFIWVLKSTELSFLYPINSLAYIWTSFLSIKYLNERMTLLKWLGVLLIIIGVFFVTR